MHRPAIYPGLEGKTVFVTGGGSGIGAALTTAFANQKAKIAFIDIAEAPSLALAEQIRAETGVEPLYLPCDIRDIQALQATIAQVNAELGDIAVLVNNAGNDQRHDVSEIDAAYWDERMAVNLRPMFFAAQAVLPQMKRLGGGTILNFGSISGINASAGFPAYATAKAAVHGLTRSLAREFGKFNIRVNTVVPGWVMTPRQIELWLTPEADKAREQAQCLPARVMPEDISDMVLFLASDAAAKCTAQKFIVDAGWV